MATVLPKLEAMLYPRHLAILAAKAVKARAAAAAAEVALCLARDSALPPPPSAGLCFVQVWVSASQQQCFARQRSFQDRTIRLATRHHIALQRQRRGQLAFLSASPFIVFALHFPLAEPETI